MQKIAGPRPSALAKRGPQLWASPAHLLAEAKHAA